MTAVLVLASCASVSPGPETAGNRASSLDSTAALRQRAEQYWKAKHDENWPVVYEFQDKSLVQEATVEDYAKWANDKEPLHIQSYQLDQVMVEESRGWVEVTFESSMRKFPNTPARSIHRWDKWCLSEGKWIPVPPQYYDQYPVPPIDRDLADEPRLRTRFEESWKARKAGDWKALYAFADPQDTDAKNADAISEAQFAEVLSRAQYQEATVQWVQVVGDHGIVEVAYKFKLTDPSLTKMPPTLQILGEQWIKRDQQWYLDLAANK